MSKGFLVFGAYWLTSPGSSGTLAGLVGGHMGRVREDTDAVSGKARAPG